MHLCAGICLSEVEWQVVVVSARIYLYAALAHRLQGLAVCRSAVGVRAHRRKVRQNAVERCAPVGCDQLATGRQCLTGYATRYKLEPDEPCRRCKAIK